MNVDGKTNSKRLEDLAISIAKDFLTATEKYPSRTMSLYGHNEEVLGLIKGKMEEYFQEVGQDVSVEFGNKAYGVDVGFFI